MSVAFHWTLVPGPQPSWPLLTNSSWALSARAAQACWAPEVVREERGRGIGKLALSPPAWSLENHSTLRGVGPQDLEGRQPPRKHGGREVGNGGPLTPLTTALPKGSVCCRPSLEQKCLHTAWDYQFA